MEQNWTWTIVKHWSLVSKWNAEVKITLSLRFGSVVKQCVFLCLCRSLRLGLSFAKAIQKSPHFKKPFWEPARCPTCPQCSINNVLRKRLALQRERGTYPKRNALLVIVVNSSLLGHNTHYADYNGDCAKRSFIKHWFWGRLALAWFAYQFAPNGKPSRKGRTLFRSLASVA